MQRNQRNLIKLCALGLSFLDTSTIAHASGFALSEQGTKGLGGAFAGAAATADDASTVYFNPAGMTRIGGSQIVAASHIVASSIKFTDTGSTSGSTPLTGGEGGNAGVLGFVPNLYYVRDISSSMKFGFGLNAPFGLSTEYDDSWQGRYHAIHSAITTTNLNPSIAFKANDKLSIGAGINLQHTDVELTNAVDLRRIVSGTSAQDGDAKVKVSGNDWGYGYDVGVLYEISGTSRIGVSYRSKVDYVLEGDAKYTPTNATATALLAGIQAGGNLVDTTVSSKTTLPESLSLAGFRQLTPFLSVAADATWTRWSRQKELRIAFDSVQADSVTPQGWKDTWRYGLGVNWTPVNAWSYRAGIAYDQTPVPNAELRSPRTPDNSRRWLAFGSTYKYSKAFTFDFGYAHNFYGHTTINNTDSSGHLLSGAYKIYGNIFSGQINWVF